MFPKIICTCDESPVIIYKIRVVWRLARGVGFEVISKGRARVSSIATSI